jgi:hypothetical protein
MDADHGLQSLSARFQFESSSSIRLFDTEHTPVRVNVFLSMLTSLSFHKNLRPCGFSVHPAMTAAIRVGSASTMPLAIDQLGPSILQTSIGVARHATHSC